MEQKEEDEGLSLSQLDIGQIKLSPGFRSNHEVVPSLSIYERIRLESLTSLNFIEFHSFNSIALHPERALLFKGFRILEKRIEELVARGQIEGDDKVDAFRIYLKLGHICLLVGDYARALSAYQQAYNLSGKYFWRDSGAYYGLGIVYLHFKAYWCAIEAFNHFLYCNPTSSIASEVNARLGVCYKAVKLFPDALRHFHAALSDNRSQSTFLSPQQLSLNIALTHDSHGEIDEAYKECSKLLNDPVVIGNKFLRAAVERELGWLCYRAVDEDICVTMDERRSKLMEAEQHLQESKRLHPDSGKTHYYLGRCYGEQVPSKAHEAFLNYRASIDKTEADSDTWCSIGVLYHQQNQPMDALQAFVCAVDLDSGHSAAWTNLGNLYENHYRFVDALFCYKSAIKYDSTAPDAINARIIAIEKELAASPALTTTQPRQGPYLQNSRLPALKEAGSQPIPSELRQRQEDQVRTKQAKYRDGSVLWKMGELGNETTMPPTERLSTPLNSSELHALKIMEDMDEDELRREEGLLTYRHNLITRHREHGHIEGCESPFDPRTILSSKSEADEIKSVFDMGPSDKSKRPKKEPSEGPRSVKKADTSNELPNTFSLQSTVYVPQEITGDDLLAKCMNRRGNVDFEEIFDESVAPPTLPDAPRETDKTKLRRITPLIVMENNKDVNALIVQQFCEKQPIALVRGMTSVLRMDLSLFSTKYMMQHFPTTKIEIRSQYKMDPDVNVTMNGEPTWDCTSEIGESTIRSYGAYQSGHFKTLLKEDSERVKAEKNSKYGDQAKRRRVQQPADETKQFQMIKFGTNLDLSDDMKYHAQLRELAKMPPFCRVIAGCNFLSHMGFNVFGMNTPQMYMKVPGNRTPAHVENNCLASVNINIGPGDCEWFGVPYEYWGLVNELCTKEGVDFLKSPWWPNYEQLIQEGIPAYRFTQKAGDLVWVGPGCIHWVQSMGFCNNVAWNVGPMTKNQFQMAVHQYEWNKMQHFMSLVPMQHVFWQLAKNVRVTKQEVYAYVRGMLIRSLSYAKMVAEWATSTLNKTIRIKPKGEGEGAVYCKDCWDEVWNIFFLEDTDTFEVWCAKCAMKSKEKEKSLHVVQHIPFNELVSIFDKFQLHSINKPPLVA